MSSRVEGGQALGTAYAVNGMREVASQTCKVGTAFTDIHGRIEQLTEHASMMRISLQRKLDRLLGMEEVSEKGLATSNREAPPEADVPKTFTLCDEMRMVLVLLEHQIDRLFQLAGD